MGTLNLTNRTLAIMDNYPFLRSHEQRMHRPDRHRPALRRQRNLCHRPAPTRL